MELPQTIEIKGSKVLTTKQIAEAYGVTKEKIIYNFNYNKDKYILGKHYIEVFGEELRRLKRTCEIQSSFKYAKSLYLWTEKGALLHAKSLNTDKAWQVYDYLVDFYFRAKEKQTDKTEATSVPDKTVRKIKKGTDIAPLFREVLETLPLEALDETEKVLRTSRNKAVKRAVISVLAEKNEKRINVRYNDQTEKTAFMIIRLLDIKAKQKY